MNEQALKARLKFIAKEQDKTFNEVWKLLLLERFLARLSCSNYTNKLIFKGGLLLSYYINIGRETIDIDLLAKKLEVEMPNIKKVLNDICNISISDGLTFSLVSIENLDHEHMNYPGFRATAHVRCENMKDNIQIDIGVGDAVEPTEISWPSFRYKNKAIFLDTISLQVYPVESIFAEKLETIISRGAANSRMKDFHDLFLLSQTPTSANSEKLTASIKSTFSTRNTGAQLPIHFSNDEYKQLQSLWSSHLRKIGKPLTESLMLPENISDVIKAINEFVKKSCKNNVSL
jgi:predicted nucleotidyltransferase component of viral defense system